MNILMILTSHDQLGDTGKKTGFWLEEFAAPYYTFLDAGADVVMGHGPHFSLAVESYKGKPVFYGLGSFSFHTGHGGRKHGNWVGMLARITVDGKAVKGATFQFVRHNDQNETVLCKLADEQETLKEIADASKVYGVTLTPKGDEVAINLQ